jgi:NAD+ synthase (glutamine-hydrolysing)
MRIALAQLNPTVGALASNTEKLLAVYDNAAAQGVDLVVTPELFLSGYPPKDLLLRSGFTESCDRAVDRLAVRTGGGPALLVGHPTARRCPEGRIANGASLLSEGRVVTTVHKLLLPNYDVFDERRYFRPSSHIAPVEFKGRRIGVHICEDAWWKEPETSYHMDPCPYPDPVAELAQQGIDFFINLSASPFEDAKPSRRYRLLARHVGRHRRPFLFCNQVGGNDDLVFDGNSLVLNAEGDLVWQGRGFEEDFHVVDTDRLPAPKSPRHDRREGTLLDALILGFRDYAHKCGFRDCVLGLSGGIDSALACYIAAKALGPEHVHGLLMPSRYSSQHSIDDAMALVKALRVDGQTIPIDQVHRAYESLVTIEGDLASQPQGLADQNLQARIREAIVMTRSNRHNWIALATGNKSELAVGYCTLYGDMCGGFAVLCDLLKRDVYALSRYVNEIEGREIIPRSTIDKPPSAELAPNQFDQDTLPPYPILDGILEGLVEREESVHSLSEQFPAETVKWVAQRLDRNEFKRRQMPPGIKLSERAFGTGRRMPMAARISYD